MRALLAALMLQLAGCSLPPIHRNTAAVDNRPDAAARTDAAVSTTDSGSMPRVGTVEDSDAGPSADPEHDPANRNESLEEFRALVPKEHLFAEWPMPDSSPQSQHKHSYTISEQVVTDNVTKLRWQRDLPDVYPGCTGNYEYVGRKRGVGTGCTWEEAQAYCQRAELAQQLGGGGWRVPTKIELESLLDVSRIHPIDPVLDDFPLDRVWSSSPIPNPEGLKLAWAIDYSEGTTLDSGRFKAGRVRCVSSPSEKGGSAQDFDFQAEYVRDNHTELVWQRFPDSATRNWRDAIAYCEGVATAGGGWRLPSFNELLTLVDTSRRFAAIQAKAFPITQSERYWTSSEYLDGRNTAYWVHFGWGLSGVVGTIADEHYVRCVR